MPLAAFGWTGQRQLDFATFRDDGLMPGRVVGEHRTHYQVAVGDAELAAETTGRLRNEAEFRSDLPGVGDFVALRPAMDDGRATIEAVLPRTSALIRKASGKETPQLLAANVDVVFIVTGLDGDLNLARIDRYLMLVRDSGATPVIIVNKAELATDLAGVAHQISQAAPGVAAHAISALSGDGIADLEPYFDGNRTIVLVGSSGVGKSTLINKFLGRDAQPTQEVRAHDSRGRHTTTHRELFLRPNGGLIIDTPGMRSLETWNEVEPVTVNFQDVEQLAATCKFRNCLHQSEPGCAVRAAVARGELTAERVASYIRPPAFGTRTAGPKIGSSR